MPFIADDQVNRSIWTESVALQRKIAKLEKLPSSIGAQQAMPRECDAQKFSPECPLPWVPDLVGEQFGKHPGSVLVVASGYNGFIEGYSGRDAVMPICEYVNARNDDLHGLEQFCRAYFERVVKDDESFYQPILRDLLPAAGCDVDCCCLTDLCKASFVKCGNGRKNGNRGDKGSDTVVRNHWAQWVPYVAGMGGGQLDAPLPYQWLWRRIQQCRAIITLGTIAEYGVLKIFQRMTGAPKVQSWRDNSVVPDHPTINADVKTWKYDYACSQRRLRDWLEDEDWWALGDATGRARWFMLPVHHPVSAIGYGNDSRYLKTVPRMRRMMAKLAETLQG